MAALPLLQMTAPTLLLLLLFALPTTASADSLDLLTSNHDPRRHHQGQRQLTRTSIPILDAIDRVISSAVSSPSSSSLSSSPIKDLSSSRDFRFDDDSNDDGDGDDEGGVLRMPRETWGSKVLMNLANYVDARGGRDTLAGIIKRVSAKTLAGASRTSLHSGLKKQGGRRRKRVEERRSGIPSLCHVLGFPEGSSGCLRSDYAWKRPDTRSAATAPRAERNDWQSMYLLGGAIGR